MVWNWDVGTLIHYQYHKKIGSKSRFFKLGQLKRDIMKLSWFKSDITNVESVEKWYYKYWIGLKLWKMSISVLCLFVNMKLLQNETSHICTDLIQNLKIKIISISVLNRYFFENFHIESNLIDIESISNRILSVSCLYFSISTMPDLQ